MSRQWTVRMATTSYTVALEPESRWLELLAWGPHGVEEGPSPLVNTGRPHFVTDADVAPVEYAPRGLRPFSGADLALAEDAWWRFDGAESSERDLRVTFRDELTGLSAVLCYRAEPGTDVLCRWVELTNTGTAPLTVERLGSAGVCLPVARARLTYLTGQWAQEFQRRQVDLPAGRFALESRFGVPGHACVPWLAVQDADRADGPAWGVSLAWSGSWELDAEIEPAGRTRIRAGRLAHPGPLLLGPGERLVTPELALAFSTDGLAGLAQVWHDYDRFLAGDRLSRRRPVLYNSWEATGFSVEPARQLELAATAAELGVELFVVDDGWFTGRHDDTGGLGDWTPDETAFPRGFGAFIDEIRALGLDFGLWVEPEAISPTSRLYAEHPDWVYHLDGRPRSLRFRFVLAMAGVLGIGADLSAWPAGQRAEARALVEKYKTIRGTIHTGRARVLASPDAPTAAVQYTARDGRVVVLAWHTGRLDGAPAVPGRSARVPLHGLPAGASYVDEAGTRYSAAHLVHAGLPFDWTPDFDADVVVLEQC